jgi:hypothetical protein
MKWARRRAQPVGEQRAVVGLAERVGRVQDAQAHVHPAVAEAEDPAVPGQQHVAVLRAAQLEPGLQVVVVGADRGAVVAPDRHAERAVVALGQAHRERELAGHAVRRDDQRRPILDGLPAGADLGVDADRAAVGVEHRAGDVHAGQQRGAGLGGPLGQHVVEVQAGAHQAVAGKAGQFRPVQLEADAAADHPEATVLQPARLLGRVDAHPDQLPGGAWGQPVAADLLPGELGLLQQQHAQAVLGHVVGRRRATRSGTDDDHIGLVGDGRRCSFVLAHGLTSVSRGLVKRFTSQPRSESRAAIEAVEG